jgi:NTP pyrophosphatase (non-canonical NTP hydrolase)
MLNELEQYRVIRNAKAEFDPANLDSQEADKSMHVLLCHTMEELVELLMCINRKSWKPMASLRGSSEESLKLRQAALEELADVLLMLDAFRDVAMFTLDEVQDAVLAKMTKNLERQDHVHNKDK